MRSASSPVFRRLLTILAAMALCLMGWGGTASAQSADPATLRRIIQQKNAEAAAATWADHPGSSMPFAPPAFGSTGAIGAGSSSGKGTGDSQGPGSSGSASFLPDGEKVTNHEAAGIKATLPAPDRSMSSLPFTRTQAATAPSSSQLRAQSDLLPASLAAGATDQTAQRISGPRRATVTYAGGLLFIHADNSSLQDILRQVARLTGMKVKGNLPDERVFGDQGPALPSAVLSSLLDGTSSNRFFRENGRALVTELILSPRQGGAPMADLGASFDNATSNPESRILSVEVPVLPLPKF